MFKTILWRKYSTLRNMLNIYKSIHLNNNTTLIQFCFGYSNKKHKKWNICNVKWRWPLHCEWILWMNIVACSSGYYFHTVINSYSMDKCQYFHCWKCTECFYWQVTLLEGEFFQSHLHSLRHSVERNLNKLGTIPDRREYVCFVHFWFS